MEKQLIAIISCDSAVKYRSLDFLGQYFIIIIPIGTLPASNSYKEYNSKHKKRKSKKLESINKKRISILTYILIYKN